MIEQNNPATLERARFQIRSIAHSKTAQEVSFKWTWAAGYFMALALENLIDEPTKQMLDAEADRARDEWEALVGSPARQAAQIEVDAATRNN
jgi:hypothetical protein